MTAEPRSFRKAVICYYYYCYYCYYFSYFMTAEPRSFRKAVIFIIVIVNYQNRDPFGRLWSLLFFLFIALTIKNIIRTAILSEGCDLYCLFYCFYCFYCYYYIHHFIIHFMTSELRSFRKAVYLYIIMIFVLLLLFDYYYYHSIS